MMSKEIKTRGKYKQYVYDPYIKMPKQTKHNILKSSPQININKSNLDKTPTFEYNNSDTGNALNFNLDIDNSLNDYPTPNLDNPGISKDFVTMKVIEDDEDEANFNKYNNNSNDDDEEDDFISELTNAYQSDEEINQKDLASAYLSAFYSGRTTQSSLSDYLKLSNITSQIKLPTSFNGLRDIVMGKNELLTYSKSWYCKNCVKTFQTLDSRHQRLCKFCSTRYKLCLILKMLPFLFSN